MGFKFNFKKQQNISDENTDQTNVTSEVQDLEQVSAAAEVQDSEQVSVTSEVQDPEQVSAAAEVQDPEQNSMPSTEQIEKILVKEYYKRDYSNAVRSTVFTLITVAAIALLIATLVLPVVRIYGVSMTPTIKEDSIVLCKKTDHPKRGDVMAFYYNNKIVIRRVIGLPGDKVDINNQGYVTVNGEYIEEDYIKDYVGGGDVTYPYTVPEGYYFMLADNRTDGIDSRNSLFGNIQQEDFIGKVIFCVWPMKQFGFIKR